mgnify:CR=1 FL=1
MSRWLRRIRWAAASPVLRCVGMAVRLLPWRCVRGIGRAIGTLAWLLLGTPRRRADENLCAVFPEMDARARRAFTRRSFGHFACVGAECLACGGARTDALWPRVHEPEALRRFVARCQPPDGVPGPVIVTAHFGNWELLGGLVSRTGGRFCTFARRMKHPELERLVDALRRDNSMRVLYTDAPPTTVLRTLRDGTGVSILPDQDITELEGVFVPFFGRPAWTPLAPARLAVLAKTDIWMPFLVRDGMDFRAVLEGPFEPDATIHDKTERMIRLTGVWTRALENAIRRFPEQWCWMHPRWRNTPDRIIRRTGQTVRELCPDGTICVHEGASA